MPEPTPLHAEVGAPWPEPPDAVVYHGLAGEIVRELAPHTEADPVALLVTLLACAGNAIGTGPHYLVSGARHELRLFPVLVGATSSGRKGTAVDTVGLIFQACNGPTRDWWLGQQSGMVSGEGLIYHVRDRVTKREAIKSKGTILGYQDVVEDQGVDDKRLLVIEKEFGGVLEILARETNTLSAVIRRAWDGGTLSTMAKNSANRATNPHVTILGHITPEELRELLDMKQARNGFANRFLWVCVQRSQLLPHGGDLDDGTILGLAQILDATLEEARGLGRLWLDAEARVAWERVYEALTTGRPGLVGALLSRGAPTVLRLASLYAALDLAPLISHTHLEAALTLWSYAEASVLHIFGLDATAAPASPYRSTILAALAGGPLTITELLDDVFGKNLRAPEPHATLDALLREGLVAQDFRRPASGKGRPAQVWSLTAKGGQEVG